MKLNLIDSNISNLSKIEFFIYIEEDTETKTISIKESGCLKMLFRAYVYIDHFYEKKKKERETYLLT